ncbi:hypothetical protein GCM10008096_24590 [Zhihengliuella salsuginis]|uniref:YdbS-like PH domain-containing protein n=1 Tax=Zhihengliuella salsuginis TaxID=578222 RepID=A0ABQ3GJI3_9MICC|nr:hypothetical protein GCM10008096_24590 [Zhihengliuella salsuginis]
MRQVPETDRAPAGAAVADDPKTIDPEGVDWLRVHPDYVKVRIFGVLIGAVVWLIITSIPLVLRSTGVWGGYPEWLAWLLPGLALLWSLIDLFVTNRRVRAIGYAERDDDLLVRQGILFKKVLVVPYGRMQYVDVQMGPVDRAFGLCKVQLHTAASDVTATIPGVTADEGARLREQLSARGEARLAGL